MLNTGRGAHAQRVSLVDRTCTGKKWEANKIPYSHLIAVCAKYNHDTTEFMDRFYHVEERYHSYEPIFQPLKDRLEWLADELTCPTSPCDVGRYLTYLTVDFSIFLVLVFAGTNINPLNLALVQKVRGSNWTSELCTSKI